MFFIFLFFINFKKSNLEKDFIPNSSKYNGDWEFGGSAYFDKISNQFQIINSKNNPTGYAWLINRLPADSWKTIFKIKFQESSTSSNLGFWVTKNFGVNGTIFGGPSKFYGFAILCNYNSTHFQIETRESDGKEDYNPLSFHPKYTYPITTPVIQIELTYNSSQFFIKLNLDEKSVNSFHITTDKYSSMRRGWLSITGQSKDPVYIDQITIESSKINFNHSQTHIQKDSNLQQFNETAEQFLRPYYTPNSLDVIQCIDEVFKLSENFCTVNEACDTISNQLLNFSDKWQRRYVLTTKQTKSLRIEIQNQLNYTENALSELKHSISKDFAEFKEDVHSIESELYYGVLKGYGLYNDLKQQNKNVKKFSLPNVIIVMSFVEMFLVFAFVLYNMLKKINIFD